MFAHAIVARLASVPILVLPFLARAENANYRVAVLFLLPILWGVYAARRRLRLRASHYALFAAALVLHDLGALGFYGRELLDVSFDTYVHAFFGFAGGLILERALRLGYELRAAHAAVATLLFLLGIGALHEIVEAASTLVLGPESGMYKLANPDELDTQKDLLCNLAGGAAAVGLVSASRGRI